MTTTQQLGQAAIEIDQPDDDDEEFTSVTTIIGATQKAEALIYWGCEQTANAAIDSASTWQAMLEDEGRDAAAKYLRDARFRIPKTRLAATALGTVVHTVCETYALSGVRPSREDVEELVQNAGGAQTLIDEETHVVGQMLNRFDDWLARFQPSYQATEVCVYSPTYGYAGTADAFLTIDGVRFITDYKTTREPRDSRGKPRTPYPEQVGLQLAAYRHADFAAVFRPRRYEKFRRRTYVLSAAERELAVPVPEVDEGLVIHITPEACEAYPMRCDEQVHNAFLYSIEVFRWLDYESKAVMGDVLTPAVTS